MLVAYDNYVAIAKCSLPQYTRYARLFFYLYAFQTFLAITLTSLTTILHAIPGYDEAGYFAGFAATAVIAFNSLIPFRNAYKESSEAAVILARHLDLREPIPGKLLYKLANTPILWFSHPTSSCAKNITPRLARSAGQSLTLQPNRQEQRTLGNPGQSTNQVPKTRQFLGQSDGQSRSQFVGESGQTTVRSYDRPSAQSNGRFRFQAVNQTAIINCVITRFDTIATRLFKIYYSVMTCQIILTTLTSLFHAFNSMPLIDVPADVARTLGIAFGGVATLLGAILLAFPVEVAARQCRQAYALTFEYYLSGSPIPDAVLDCLYEVDTMLFMNPMYESSCISA